MTPSGWSWLSSHGAIGLGGDGVQVDLLPVDAGSTGSQGLDDLGRDDQSLLDDQDASVVVVDAGMIRARGDCHQVI